MVSWLAPAEVWKVRTVATGMPGGKAAASRLLVNMCSPLCSGVCGATRSAVMELDGPCPSTIPVNWFAERHADLRLPVGDEADDRGVVEGLDHLTDQAPGTDDRIADVDAVGATLVQRDRRGEVRRVLVLGLRGDRRQRLQEGQVLQRGDLAQLVLLEALLQLRRPQLADRPLQPLVLRPAPIRS